MTLDTLRQAVEGEDTILSVGSKSAYLFIGTKADYDREIDEVSDRARALLCTQLQETERTIRSLKTALATGNVRRDSISPESMKKKLAEFEVRQQRLTNAIDRFTPLREREVIDLYRRLDPDDGWCVIIEGEERGEAWMKVEYDRLKAGREIGRAAV